VVAGHCAGLLLTTSLAPGAADDGPATSSRSSAKKGKRTVLELRRFIIPLCRLGARFRGGLGRPGFANWGALQACKSLEAGERLTLDRTPRGNFPLASFYTWGRRRQWYLLFNSLAWKSARLSRRRTSRLTCALATGPISRDLPCPAPTSRIPEARVPSPACSVRQTSARP